MNTFRNPVPDLLKRHVPTPYKLIAKDASLETNDPDILEQFEIGNGSVRLAEVAPNFHLRIVRDETASTGSGELQVLREGMVCVLLVGEGSVIMVDREHHKVFGFLAPDLSNERFAQVYLPLAINHNT
jgi:hypothetical protein